MKADDEQRVERLRAEAIRRETSGTAVLGDLRPAGMKNPPPPGIAYSANFARCQRMGMFAPQTRD